MEPRMETMQKIAGGFDTTMIANAVLRQFGDFPDKLTLRGKTPHGPVMNWLHFDMLPQLRPLIFGVMTRIEGEELGEVELVKLPAGTEMVSPALAQGEHYVIGLQVPQGAALGKPPQLLLPGDIWWVSGKMELVLGNVSDADAWLLVMGAVPNGPATYLPE